MTPAALPNLLTASFIGSKRSESLERTATSSMWSSRQFNIRDVAIFTSDRFSSALRIRTVRAGRL